MLIKANKRIHDKNIHKSPYQILRPQILLGLIPSVDSSNHWLQDSVSETNEGMGGAGDGGNDIIDQQDSPLVSFLRP